MTTLTHSPRTKAAAQLIAVLAIVLAALGTVDASPALAYSSTQQTSTYWWPHNGCSTPTGDAPSGVSFTYACNHHDGCYWGRWSNSKATCDQWFLNDMLAACSSNGYCRSWAYAYYAGVTVGGWPYWWCRCDPTFTPRFA